MFSDRSIRQLISKGAISISPQPEDIQFQPASIDLLLWHEFVLMDGSDDRKIVRDVLWLEPGDCLLASTMEWVKLPGNVIARVEGKSSWGRQFLMVHATAGFIDPGFEGRITLELKNLSPRSIRLKAGQAICQISFDWLSCPADRPYGHPDLGSRYQFQSGATPAVQRD